MKIAVTRTGDMRCEATRQSLLASFQKNQAGSRSHLCSPFRMCGDVLASCVRRTVVWCSTVAARGAGRQQREGVSRKDGRRERRWQRKGRSCPDPSGMSSSPVWFVRLVLGPRCFELNKNSGSFPIQTKILIGTVFKTHTCKQLPSILVFTRQMRLILFEKEQGFV